MWTIFHDGFDTGWTFSDIEVARAIARDLEHEWGGTITVQPLE